jgi:hypothetical protein
MVIHLEIFMKSIPDIGQNMTKWNGTAIFQITLSIKDPQTRIITDDLDQQLGLDIVNLHNMHLICRLV